MGRVWESLKQFRNWNLRSDKGRNAPKAIVEDLKDIAGFRWGDEIPHPVVEDEQFDLSQVGKQIGEEAIQDYKMGNP
jgi:hypothetical protein